MTNKTIKAILYGQAETRYRKALLLEMCYVINIIKCGEIIFIQKNVRITKSTKTKTILHINIFNISLILKFQSILFL